MGVSWFDSDNIIFIKYHGGAGGFALRQIIGLSSGTDVKLWPEVDIRDDGAAHVMLDRNDIFTDISCSNRIGFREMISDASGIESHDLPSANIDKDVIDQLKLAYDRCWSFNGTPMQQAVLDRKIVISDHLPINLIRLLFPKATVIRLMRDIRYSQRCFFLKNLMQSPRYDLDTFDGYQHHATSLDAMLYKKHFESSFQNYKKVIRHRMESIYREYADQGMADHDVDGDALFDPEKYQGQYLSLMKFCGLETNLGLVNSFIKRYHQLQYKRLSYQPNPDWGWVKAAYF